MIARDIWHPYCNRWYQVVSSKCILFQYCCQTYRSRFAEKTRHIYATNIYSYAKELSYQPRPTMMLEGTQKVLRPNIICSSLRTTCLKMYDIYVQFSSLKKTYRFAPESSSILSSKNASYRFNTPSFGHIIKIDHSKTFPKKTSTRTHIHT